MGVSMLFRKKKQTIVLIAYAKSKVLLGSSEALLPFHFPASIFFNKSWVRKFLTLLLITLITSLESLCCWSKNSNAQGFSSVIDGRVT